MLRVILAALLLGAFGASAEAQWASKPNATIQRWKGSLEPPLIQQVRFPRGSANGAVPAFNGSPAVTISNGTIAGSIDDSRTGDGSTFRTPFFIQVSASSIRATGTSAPYEDLSYSWRFLINGVPQCGDTFTRPTDGATVCSGLDQRGPEAAFVLRASGTLTAELTVTGSSGTCNSAGICQTVTPYVVTKSWTVNAFPANDKYVKAGACVTSCAGTQADPYNSIAQVNSNLANNTAFHFCKGDAFTGSTGLVINGFAASVSSLRFDDGFPGCTGANPKIEINSGTNGALLVSNGGSSSPAPVNDLVFSGLDLVKSTGASGGGTVFLAQGNATAAYQNLYFDNVSVNQTADLAGFVLGMPEPPQASFVYPVSGWGFWNVAITNPTTTVNVGIGAYGSASNWHFMMGGTVSGGGGDPTKDHHVYNEIKSHGLYQWLNCGPTGAGNAQRSYCVNGNWDGLFLTPTDHQVAQYFYYGENSCQYTSLCIDLGNRSNNTSAADSTVQFQYAVLSGNALIGQAATQFLPNALSITLRDNRMWGSLNSGGNNAGFYSPNVTGQLPGYGGNTTLLSKSYRNKIYFPVTAGANYIFGFLTSGATWTVPQYIAYNTIVDARSPAQMIGIVWSDWISDASKIDFNIYSAPAGGTTSWTDGGTAKTFPAPSGWQGAGTSPSRWDANGTNLGSATPSGWTLPVTQWSHMGP